MSKRAFASILVALAAVSACHKAPESTQTAAVPEQHFSILLQRSDTGWTAHCEVGCHWIDLSFHCVSCEWRLDADGVSNYDLNRSSSGFAFVLSDEHNGWSARGLRGVRWLKLSWSCGTAVCRGRVDETGVRAPEIGSLRNF
jgi:hypothetical protein